MAKIVAKAPARHGNIYIAVDELKATAETIPTCCRLSMALCYRQLDSETYCFLGRRIGPIIILQLIMRCAANFCMLLASRPTSK